MIMQPRQNFMWSCQFQYDRDVDVVQYTWHPIVEAGKLVGIGFFLHTMSVVIILPGESAKYKQLFWKQN